MQLLTTSSLHPHHRTDTHHVGLIVWRSWLIRNRSLPPSSSYTRTSCDGTEEITGFRTDICKGKTYAEFLPCLFTGRFDNPDDFYLFPVVSSSRPGPPMQPKSHGCAPAPHRTGQADFPTSGSSHPSSGISALSAAGQFPPGMRSLCSDDVSPATSSDAWGPSLHGRYPV